MLVQCFGAKLQIINNFYIIQSSHNFGSQSSYLCDQHIIFPKRSEQSLSGNEDCEQLCWFIKPELEAVLQHTLQNEFTLHKVCYFNILCNISAIYIHLLFAKLLFWTQHVILQTIKIMPLVGIYSPFFQALFDVNFTFSKCVDLKNWQMSNNRWAVLTEHLMGGIWHLSGIWFILLWIIVINMIMDHQIFVKCMSMQLECYIFQNMACVDRRWW